MWSVEAIYLHRVLSTHKARRVSWDTKYGVRSQDPHASARALHAETAICKFFELGTGGE